MAKSRNASPVLFGFEFQVNATIVLMLKRINELKRIRLEGNYEDIELTLEDGKKIYAQAKAVVDATNDIRHVRENLKKALNSLSDADKNKNALQLIYITNSRDPFNDEDSKRIFYGITYRKINELPKSAQTILMSNAEKIAVSFNWGKFLIMGLPFETDDEHERYKYVYEAVSEFLGRFNYQFQHGAHKILHLRWGNLIGINGTKNNKAIELEKKDIVWTIITLVTSIDGESVEERYRDLLDIDWSDYETIIGRYHEIIECHSDSFSFFTSVIRDFVDFQNTCGSKNVDLLFVNSSWEKYKNIFNVDGIDPDILKGLTKVTLLNVIRRRRVISNIKKEVML